MSKEPIYSKEQYRKDIYPNGRYDYNVGGTELYGAVGLILSVIAFTMAVIGAIYGL